MKLVKQGAAIPSCLAVLSGRASVWSASSQVDEERQGAVTFQLLLDVVVRKGAAILQLLSSKEQGLQGDWDTLLVLDLCLQHLDGGVACDDVDGESLAFYVLDFDGHGLKSSRPLYNVAFPP